MAITSASPHGESVLFSLEHSKTLFSAPVQFSLVMYLGPLPVPHPALGVGGGGVGGGGGGGQKWLVLCSLRMYASEELKQ